jgi:hypothetical protein
MSREDASHLTMMVRRLPQWGTRAASRDCLNSREMSPNSREMSAGGEQKKVLGRWGNDREGPPFAVLSRKSSKHQNRARGPAPELHQITGPVVLCDAEVMPC